MKCTVYGFQTGEHISTTSLSAESPRCLLVRWIVTYASTGFGHRCKRFDTILTAKLSYTIEYNTVRRGKILHCASSLTTSNRAFCWVVQQVKFETYQRAPN